MEYERESRAFGEPKYTLRGLIKLAVDGIFNFSYKPLQIVMVCGSLIAAGAFILAGLVLWQYLQNVTILGYNPRQTRGWTSLLLTLLFLTGVQLIATGILGEYVGRLFDEVKARPVFLVKEAVNFDPDIMARGLTGESRAQLDASVQYLETIARRLTDEAIREIGRHR